MESEVEGHGGAGEAAVETGLAQYAFVREEREREVRLLFRDVPADTVARTFLNAGAQLITLSGERTIDGPGRSILNEEEGQPVEVEANSSPKQRKASRPASPASAVTLRYFYTLGETVYTVQLVSSAGIIESIRGVYPLAALGERELQERLAVVFLGAGD